MNDNRTKEFLIFLAILVVIVFIFAGGLIYIKTSGSANSSATVADAASSSASTTAVADIATSTPTSTVATSTVTTTSTIAKTTSSTVSTSTKKTSSGGVAVAPKAPTTTTTIAKATTTVAVAPPVVLPKATSTPVVTPAPPAPVVTASATTTQTLPYTISTFATNDGWTDWWGSLSQANGIFTYGGDADNSGGGALLNGSSAWTNYTFATTVDWQAGETFDLVARYTNSHNYVSCEFDNDGTVSIHRVSDGQNIVIGQGIVSNFPTSGLQVSITAQDDHVTCSMNGSVINDTMYQGLPEMLRSGGIGFDAWDPTVNNSQIVVDSISVTPLST